MRVTVHNSWCSRTSQDSYDRRRSQKCRPTADDTSLVSSHDGVMTTPTTTATNTPATNTTAPVLQLEQLTKHYRDHVAVDHLTVDVPAGVVAGFIGPNGAG